MKNLLLLTVSVLLGTIQLVANTNPNTSAFFIPENEISIVLDLENLEVETLSILDQNGNQIFVDAIEQNKARIKYDLKRFPQGSYTVKLDGKSFVEFYQASISNNAINLERINSFSRPTLTTSNNKVQVTIKQASQDGLTVTILNSSSEVIYRYHEDVNNAYRKSFNLKDLESGRYNIVVNTGYFSEQLNITL